MGLPNHPRPAGTGKAAIPWEVRLHLKVGVCTRYSVYSTRTIMVGVHKARLSAFLARNAVI